MPLIKHIIEGNDNLLEQKKYKENSFITDLLSYIQLLCDQLTNFNFEGDFTHENSLLNTLQLKISSIEMCNFKGIEIFEFVMFLHEFSLNLYVFQ